MIKEDGGDELLSPLAAALHLGITAELLFQYTKSSFAKASGLGSLPTVEHNGQTRFSRRELENFDTLLKGPWTLPSSSRPAIPKAILDHLRAESRNQCARCGSGIGVDTAHIRPWAETRSHHPGSLIRICSACHREHDAQHSLPREELLRLKERLIARTRDTLLQRSRPSLLRAPRPALRFAGRGKESAWLRDHVSAGRSVLITGPGGAGKSELVLQVLDQWATDRLILWVDIERYGSSADVLFGLRSALAVNGTACRQDELPTKLEEIAACVVLDGLEQGGLADLDAFEDAIFQLHEQTRTVQFISTSQIMLHRLPADARLRLSRLDDEASRLLLADASSDCGPDGDAALGPLLDFCDGHALTLRLTGAIIDHYGSPAAALKQIERKGARAVRLPGRSRQDRATSLERCLDLAYGALSPAARKILWTLALTPAGILTHFLDGDWLELGKEAATEAAAELKRWHLSELLPIEGQITRTYCLSPIRRFADEKGRFADGDEFERSILRLAHSLSMMVAVLELDYDDPNETPYVLHRYGKELPNFLHLLELAKERPGNGELAEMVVAIVRSLMRYFFVMRLPEQGARVMHDAATLALTNGKLKIASGLAMQMIALAERGGLDSLIDEGLAIVDRIEAIATDGEIVADAKLSRAIVARDRGDLAEAEQQARAAFAGYQQCLRSLKEGSKNDSGDSSFAADELHNDMSNALGILGDALLSQRRYADAADAYRHSLKHLRGASVAVNRGQTLHQIGNCESNLGNHAIAASHYLDAARIFGFVGMEEFLSTALGELGYTLLDVDLPELVEGLEPVLLDQGLGDLDRDIRRIFDPAEPLDHQHCIGAIRKLFGTICLVSLTPCGEALGAFCIELANATITPIGQEIDSGAREEDEIFPLMMVNVALRLGVAVAAAEQSFEADGEVAPEAIDEALRLVCTSHDWAQDVMRAIDWLSVFLTRRWNIEGADRKRLRQFAGNLRNGIKDELELRRPPRTQGDDRSTAEG